jgi:3-phosphoshikimate 1-carboxyvinyltransferase
MTSLLINKGHFKTPLEIPRSKSFANRALILSALSKKSKTIQFLPSSTDVTFLIKALEAVGLKIDRHGEETTFKNSFPECETSQVESVHIGEGGTTARFFACLLMKGSLRYELILGERLKERPWTSFIKLMNDLGGKVSLVGNKLTLQGPVSLPPHLEVDCSHTTQFASGLQMAFPQSQILPYLMKTSQSYWDLTVDIIKKVSSLDTVTVPMDWSSASYPLAFAAINQEIELRGLRYDPLQADAKFLTLLRKLGAIKKEDDHGITVGLVTKKEPITIDVQDCLDLVPALSFFLAHIPGEHTLVGIENLVHKESNRLSEVRQLLTHFNRSSELVGSILKIAGSEEKINHKVPLKMPDDHRMIMAGTLFLLHHEGGEISPTEAVNKSFPGFFSLLK